MGINDCQFLKVTSQIEDLVINLGDFGISLDKSETGWESQFKFQHCQDLELQINHLLSVVGVVRDVNEVIDVGWITLFVLGS